MNVGFFCTSRELTFSLLIPVNNMNRRAPPSFIQQTRCRGARSQLGTIVHLKLAIDLAGVGVDRMIGTAQNIRHAGDGLTGREARKRRGGPLTCHWGAFGYLVGVALTLAAVLVPLELVLIGAWCGGYADFEGRALLVIPGILAAWIAWSALVVAGNTLRDYFEDRRPRRRRDRT